MIEEDNCVEEIHLNLKNTDVVHKETDKLESNPEGEGSGTSRGHKYLLRFFSLYIG